MKLQRVMVQPGQKVDQRLSDIVTYELSPLWFDDHNADEMLEVKATSVRPSGKDEYLRVRVIREEGQRPCVRVSRGIGGARFRIHDALRDNWFDVRILADQKAAE